MKNEKEIRKIVLDRYRIAASMGEGGCCGTTVSCCGAPVDKTKKLDLITRLGYAPEAVSTIPEGASLGLGCGNPIAIASLRPGEVVLDLGCGAGLDCFLAAQAVGEKGAVIGIDMTPEMILIARKNAQQAGFQNVDFRLGEIENLPVADETVDVVISNCVVNLSPRKDRVFSEAFRVLKPGGRLAISDVVATTELPEDIRKDPELHASCIAGAVTISELESMLRAAGFVDVSVEPIPESRAFIKEWAPGSGAEDYIVSAIIKARKPR